MKRDFQFNFDSKAAGSAEHRSRQWQLGVPLVAFALVWVLAWYASTATSMAEIWSRSDTFVHGYVVPVIVLWLVWRKRDELATMAPRPAWWALGSLVVAGFIWLLGELAAVNSIAQFALIALVVLTVVTILGTSVARQLAFPLAFLFFAWPIGEFFLPHLMEWTADFIVHGLRLSGVPVYREGQQLVIPSGVWSVVEACSGLRYLIASLMTGTLFAYLMYRSTKRRLIFVALALAIPIIANWLRAYMIVMLGHLSGNKIAVGVDHLIYGWLFFAVVIACMFWIGARWREDHLPVQGSATSKAVASPPTRARSLLAAGAAVLALAIVWKIGYIAIDRGDASPRPQLAAPTPAGDWLQTAGAPGKWQPQFVNPSAELQRTFGRGDQTVGLFVSYYRDQNHRSKLVTSENTLVKSDDPAWIRVESGTQLIDYNGQSITVRTAELRSPSGQELLIWQWYWINGRLTSSDYWAKGYTALSRLQAQGDDSAAIVVYTAKDRANTASKALESFVRAAAPSIEAGLRETRNAR